MKKSNRIFTKAIGVLLVAALLFVSMLALPLSVSAATDYYVRGTFTNWDAREDFKMTRVSGDDYTLTVTIPAGDHKFKIATQDWSFNFPNSDEPLQLASDTTLRFDANMNYRTFKVTEVELTPNYITLSTAKEKVRLSCCWYGHSDLKLCDKTSYVGYTSAEDESTLWNIVPISGENKVYIISYSSNKYMALDGDAVALKDTADESCEWLIDNVTGNYRFVPASDTARVINIEALSDKADCTEVPITYHSAQFKMNYTDFSYTMGTDTITDTMGTATATNGTSITSNVSGKDKTWTLNNDISSAPTFKAENTPMLEAVYNLSVEETIINQFESKFGTAFYTGENWKKVWTRDTAMSCQYCLADIFPDISLNCAKEKVVGSGNKMLLEEDTGSGGSYPVSSDRVITMLSVWEIYLATGDKDVLDYFYDIAKNTINQDYNVIYDKESGLMRGETCGTDWRDQTYPDWTSETKDNSLTNIAEGKAASTNIIYCRVLEIMSRCADILGKGEKEVADWTAKYDSLYKAITTRLWHEDLGLYAAWEYPSYMGSPLAYKADVIANGYALMFGIGSEEQLQSIAENYPLVTYGAPTVYPQKQGALHNANKVYHNRGVWPGWEATLMLGAGENGYDALSEEIWNSCVRGCATSLTNKEVIDFTTGEGIESSRQLWSVAGTIAGYYKVLYGMIYSEDGLKFEPYVPDWCEGPFTLSNYPYRDATLTINLSGKGSVIQSIKVDGKAVDADCILPADISGAHTIDIVVAKDEAKAEKINLNDDTNHVVCPALPSLVLNGSLLRWSMKPGYTYKLWDGTQYIDLDGSYTSMTVPDDGKYHCYSLVAISDDGVWSEMSAPKVYCPDSLTIKVEAESGTFKTSNLRTSPSGYSGSGVVDDSMSNTSAVSVTVDAPKAGVYMMDCVYNNHNSQYDPTSSSNCAIRSVYVNGEDAGALVFPVVNYDYQISTHLPVELKAGKNEVTIVYDKDNNFYDTNMSGTVNNVQYDYFTFREASALFDYEAPVEKYILGDVDGSGGVEIVDATIIQRKLAKLAVDNYDEIAADADADGEITIVDATTIQRYLAKLLKNSNVGKEFEK